MALKHFYTILCDYAFQTESGRYVFAGTFNNFTPPHLPAVPQRFFLAVSFIGDEGEQFEVSIVEPKNKRASLFRGTLGEQPKLINPSQIGTYVICLDLSGAYNFDQEGLHFVELRQSKRVIHRRPFGVFVKTDNPTEEGKEHVEPDSGRSRQSKGHAGGARK